MPSPDLAQLERELSAPLARMEAETHGPTPYEMSRDRTPVIRVCKRGHKVTVWTGRLRRDKGGFWECEPCGVVRAKLRRKR